MEEARRCLGCPGAPCRGGCPVGVHIPQFIAKVAEGDFAAAWEILSADNTLPAVCGRVCPRKTSAKPSVSGARRAKASPSAGWNALWPITPAQQEPKAPSCAEERAKKVAVVGSGPAGLACVGELARMGYSVTVFEALHTPGGVLAYGIPAFRLPKDILHEEIAGLEKAGRHHPDRHRHRPDDTGGGAAEGRFFGRIPGRGLACPTSWASWEKRCAVFFPPMNG